MTRELWAFLLLGGRSNIFLEYEKSYSQEGKNAILNLIVVPPAKVYLFPSRFANIWYTVICFDSIEYTVLRNQKIR